MVTLALNFVRQLDGYFGGHEKEREDENGHLKWEVKGSLMKSFVSEVLQNKLAWNRNADLLERHT